MGKAQAMFHIAFAAAKWEEGGTIQVTTYANIEVLESRNLRPGMSLEGEERANEGWKMFQEILKLDLYRFRARAF